MQSGMQERFAPDPQHTSYCGVSLDHPNSTGVHLKTTLKIYFTHAPRTLTPPPPPFSFETFFIQMFLSLTTKLIESSTIAHSDEEEERKRHALEAGLTAISLNGLWVTFTLTAS